MNNLKQVKELWNSNCNHRGGTMHIYIHSPFCVGICNYCMYESIDMKDINKNEYDIYFEGLLNQIREFKDILENKKIDSVYFGGGTPSIMPFKVLEKIVVEIPNWKDIPVKVFEANPISMTKSKIDTLVELGYTYLSLGVQTLDKEELKRQNRKPPKDGHLKDITEYALNKGLHVNYDIMTLINDDIVEDMDRVYKDLMLIMKEYKPPSIDIYPMDQKLNNVTHQEILDKIQPLRKAISKSAFFNKDYHVAGGIQNVDAGNIEDILKTFKSNYHLLNIPDNEFFGKRKVYSCSGPRTAPNHQSVISFGGHEGLKVYSYGLNKDFIYYSNLDKEGKAKYFIKKVTI